jgi:putative ABC transport system permease protein
VACLGIFGLASFSAEQRTKEIGIRKVLGASVPGLVLLLARNYSRWVVWANLFAWPAAYLAARKWLAGFAYRTPLGAGPFVLAGLLALAIALVSVLVQTVKAAASQPIDSLRYE